MPRARWAPQAQRQLMMVAQHSACAECQWIVHFKKTKMGPSLVAKWLRFQAPKVASSGSPGQGIRFHMLHLRLVQPGK